MTEYGIHNIENVEKVIKFRMSLVAPLSNHQYVS